MIKGVYQLKCARSYAEERSSTTDLTGSVNYTIHRCKEFPHLIRAPTRSAHKNRLHIIRPFNLHLKKYWIGGVTVLREMVL